MAFDDEEEDLVVYGTPIEREEDTSARKRRAVADAGQPHALPAWKQEVSLSPSFTTLSLVAAPRDVFLHAGSDWWRLDC